MYASNPYHLQKVYTQVRPIERDGEFWSVCAALKTYRRVRNQAVLNRLWSLWRRSPRHLMALKMIEETCTVRNRHYAGLQAVPISKIRGSESREDEFDADFCPVCPQNKERWVGVAAAWHMGAALPPVELIQVGDIYFVRDGHHRVSVARALGQENIDAEVVAWDVAGPLPWERPVVLSQMAGQPA